ncbi:hypothetical protein glysoja_009538 [Glycine soja]|nr:hypothetical protein glysoja_009538 [Glycine soja]
MAPPAARSYPLHGLKLPITVLFIFFLSFLPSKSGGSVMVETREGLEQRKMVIGSKPPACVNKCRVVGHAWLLWSFQITKRGRVSKCLLVGTMIHITSFHGNANVVISCFNRD